jgi:hypothetical protein
MRARLKIFGNILTSSIPRGEEAVREFTKPESAGKMCHPSGIGVQNIEKPS